MVRRPPINDKKPLNIKALFKLIGFSSGIVALIFFLIKYYNIQENPCKIYLDEIRAKIGMQYFSADKQYYHIITRKDTFDLTNDSTKSFDNFFNNVKSPNFYKDLDKLKSKIIVPINDSLLKVYLEKANKKNRILADKKVIGNLLIYRDYIPNEKIEFEIPDICKFKYNTELLTPKKFENILPRKIYQTITLALDKCDAFQKALMNPLDVPVNLSEIYKCLEENPEFLEDLKNIMSEYDTFFKIVDTGLGWIGSDKKVYFERGEYKISGFYAIIIDKLLKEYEKYIRNNPNQSVITCVGYSDPTPINKKYGIKYWSNGNFSPSNKPITYQNGISLGGAKIDRYIKENIQLSYGRAFSGIQYIETNFDEKLKKDKRVEIEFQYKGSGIDSGNSDDKYKRRIEVSLTKKNKERKI